MQIEKYLQHKYMYIILSKIDSFQTIETYFFNNL